MKALIFGVSGQDGYYLSRLLARNQLEVVGVSRTSGDVKGDIADYAFVEEIIRKHVPDYIFHLAADSTTKHDALFANHTAISTGTLNVLEAARKISPDSKIFLTGSAMQFYNDGTPISELSHFAADNAYAVARIQSVYAARYFRKQFGTNVYVGYLFNHDSSLRNGRHVNKMIVDAARSIANRQQHIIELGDLTVQKEFNHAIDVVEAIWMLVNQNKHHELIIGSGMTHTIEEWVAYCFKKYDLDWKEHVKIQPGFKSEYSRLVSDNKILCSLGWKPQIKFEVLAEMMLVDNNNQNFDIL
jgi:GDPmannose 4,6-dehydratase